MERASEENHEYSGGQTLAMAGANRRHRLITANIHFALRGAEAASGFLSDTSDTRLYIPATKSSTYPDVVMDTLLNPTLIVEVPSPGTEAYDRGKKFISYTSIPFFAVACKT